MDITRKFASRDRLNLSATDIGPEPTVFDTAMRTYLACWQGNFGLAGAEIHFGRIENREIKTAVPSFFFPTERRSDPWLDPAAPFPNVTLRATGESIHNLLHNHQQAIGGDTLDWALRSLDTPYDGLDDVLTRFLGLPKPPWGSVIESARLEIVAPFPLHFGDECNLYRGTLILHVEGAGYKRLDQISVGLIELHHSLPLRRRSFRFDAGDWHRADNCFIARRQLDTPSVSSIIITLRFADVTLDRLVLEDSSMPIENPLITAYGHFDKDLDALRMYLKGEGRDRGRDFEIGVCLLLHFCGFNVGPYCRVPKIQEEIDLVAFSLSSNAVVAAECTTANIDVNEKLSKLSRRTKELREVLHRFTVTSLVFTSLAKAKISNTDLAKATNEDIGVVAAEEIKELLDLAAQRKPLDEILKYLSALIYSQRTLFRDEMEHPWTDMP